MLRIRPYDVSLKRSWDSFVLGSKNGTFLFFRDYMEYHADRFHDHSLVILDGDEVVGLLPASASGTTLVSHAGLTYGGVVSGPSMRTATMLGTFRALGAHLAALGFERLVYKAVPHIYHSQPAEEDLYALTRFGARLYRRDVSSAIPMSRRLPVSKGRRWALKQANAAGMVVAQSEDFEGFMALEEAVLSAKYGVRPVHSAEELRLLAGRFPRHIKLFVATRGAAVEAGVVVYEDRRVAHAQYIATSDDGRRLGALDLVMAHLLTEVYVDKPYFDFGISTEREGRYLNEGLVRNKEGYGARAIVHDFYEIEIGAMTEAP
jgi:hypothetical protein